MKKVMFAMAALAAGVTFADVTSQNIVGYQTQEFTNKNKNNIIGIQFKGIGGVNYELKDIVVKRADTGETGNGATVLWLWDVSKNSYTAKFKYWSNVCDANGIPTGKPGWGDGEMIETNFTFKVGDGVWLRPGVGLSTAGRRPMVTIAGEVLNVGSDVQYYTIELANKNKNFMMSNPFPTDCQLSDIVVYRADTAETGNGATAFWIYDVAKSAYTAKLKYWNNVCDANGNPTGKPGWGDGEMISTNMTISAGQGFWIRPGVGLSTAGRRPMLRFNNPFFFTEK